MTKVVITIVRPSPLVLEVRHFSSAAVAAKGIAGYARRVEGGVLSNRQRCGWPQRSAGSRWLDWRRRLRRPSCWRQDAEGLAGSEIKAGVDGGLAAWQLPVVPAVVFTGITDDQGGMTPDRTRSRQTASYAPAAAVVRLVMALVQLDVGAVER